MPDRGHEMDTSSKNVAGNGPAVDAHGFVDDLSRLVGALGQPAGSGLVAHPRLRGPEGRSETFGEQSSPWLHAWGPPAVQQMGSWVA
jgi:hypothetical protein